MFTWKSALFVNVAWKANWFEIWESLRNLNGRLQMISFVGGYQINDNSNFAKEGLNFEMDHPLGLPKSWTFWNFWKESDIKDVCALGQLHSLIPPPLHFSSCFYGKHSLSWISDLTSWFFFMGKNQPEASEISEMDSGEKRLNELGYKQELRREMVLSFLIWILSAICSILLCCKICFIFFWLR